MAAARPDVRYHILELDVLKKTEPEKVGRVFRDVMARVAAESCNPSSTAGGRWRRRAPRSASCGPRATSGRSW